jgi:DnaJ-class molecular chaperone
MGLPALPAPPIDPLVILGLAESHSAAELRRAWRAYASRHHPDQGGDAATFSRGRAAYQTLLGRTKNRS